MKMEFVSKFLSAVKIQTAKSSNIVKLLTKPVPILAYGILADPMHLEHPEYPSTMFVTANVSPVSPETPKPDAYPYQHCHPRQETSLGPTLLSIVWLMVSQ
jgi:hypothetical protein